MKCPVHRGTLEHNFTDFSNDKTIVISKLCIPIRTSTLTWTYAFAFLPIYNCFVWTFTSINNTNPRAHYRISAVTCSMTTRM